MAGISVASPVKIGGVTLTKETAAGYTGALVADGLLFSAHDALYDFAADMQSNGTLTTANATNPGLPRWILTNVTGQRVKYVRQIPAAWNQIAVRFGWDKEAATSGNVSFNYHYRLIYPFQEQDVNTGAVTTVSLGQIAVPGTQYQFKYELPAGIAAIDTADGLFNSKPFLLGVIERVASTYTGDIGVSLATITRTA